MCPVVGVGGQRGVKDDKEGHKSVLIYRWEFSGGGFYRTSLVYALQNWLSESPDQAARKPGSNPGILGVAMGLMAVFIVCFSPSFPHHHLLPFSLFQYLYFLLYFFFLFQGPQEASNPVVNQ